MPLFLPPPPLRPNTDAEEEKAILASLAFMKDSESGRSLREQFASMEIGHCAEDEQGRLWFRQFANTHDEGIPLYASGVGVVSFSPSGRSLQPLPPGRHPQIVCVVGAWAQ